MKEIFSFFRETSKKSFLKSQSIIINHEDYDPYSEDLNILENLLDEEEYSEVINYNEINIMLSPRAHLYKSYALQQIGNEKDARMETIIADKILEGISLTGDGTLEFPYIVTRISDERDFLRYLNEDPKIQSLIKSNDKTIDLLECVSGKQFHFDITNCFKRMQNLIDKGKLQLSLEEVEQKKWWQFWK
ncbi:DUF4919 domain-containing protein [Flavobacterium artemisiae]|uniref:DUF4919 domain-containing protein n=1 Tax=Flavobacterium artemisiae TaxID=2126556 RepID=A0ABW4HKJ2_9FLAO